MILNIFNALTLKQIFCKRKIFCEKLEHRFIVESTTIASTQFLCKTALSKASVKTNNRMGSAKCPYPKNAVSLLTTLFS